VGELSWVTGAPASADVVATGGVRCLCWERDALKEFLEHHPVIRQALQVILGEDLARKLGRSYDPTEELSTQPAEE
jgi:CRP-like cAMP-binding protein